MRSNLQASYAGDSRERSNPGRSFDETTRPSYRGKSETGQSFEAGQSFNTGRSFAEAPQARGGSSFGSDPGRSFAETRMSNARTPANFAQMEAFEIEDGQEDNCQRKSAVSSELLHGKTAKRFCCITLAFPMAICCCLPMSIRVYVPTTWSLAQGWTHLSMLAGICAACFILGERMCSIVNRRGCSSTLCLEEFLIFLTVTPCLVYMGKMVGRYDEHIKSKHHAVAERKAELAGNVDQLIGNMDSILGKVTESSAMLAEMLARMSFLSQRQLRGVIHPHGKLLP